MTIDDFIRLVESKTGRTVKKSGQGYMACCPAHEDSIPSLSISQENDGRVLVNCFSGCGLEEICSSILNQYRLYKREDLEEFLQLIAASKPKYSKEK